MRVADVLAGALLVNTIPHVVRGCTGSRGLTPFGADSSPGTNLGWAAMNGAGAAALLAAGGRRRRIDDSAAAERLVGVQVGVWGMATFAALYELTAGRRKRAERIAVPPHG